MLSICSSDVLKAPITNYLGKEFNNASLLSVETLKGYYDLILDSEDELLLPGNERLVANIESFLEKKFITGSMDGIQCYVHAFN